MKIGLVTPRFAPLVGGVELHVEHIARHLAAAGHTVEVLTEAPRADVHSGPMDGYFVRRFPLARTPAHYEWSPALWTYLRRQGDSFDVLHAHNYHSLAALAPAAMTHTPVVLTPHYHGTSASAVRRALHQPYRVAGRRLLQRARRVICVSRRERQLLERHFPAAGERITVIPNGVDLESITAADPYPVSKTVVLSAGRLEGYKGVDRVIAAVSHLDDHTELVVTGEGPERRRLADLVRQLDLGHRVQLVGRIPVDELHRWFRTADVYVTASAIEAMPLTPLEVLAAGATVVASDIDAHREVADVSGGAVRLFPLDIEPPDLAREITAAVKARANRLSPRIPDWGAVAEDTLAVYAAALAIPPSSL